MVTPLLHFSDQDATLDRLDALAKELGVTQEMLVKRAISAYLGAYGLRDLPPETQVDSLADLFEARGLLKPDGVR